VLPALTGPSAYDPSGCADFRVAVAEYEKAILAAALEKCRWNQRQAAKELKLTYDQLRHALRRHEMQ
jgi:psp operon transcriptional activator